MSSPNILFLMTDQMQGRVLEPDNPCRTPNLDRLAARGVRFRRAYTPNAICSPATGWTAACRPLCAPTRTAICRRPD